MNTNAGVPHFKRLLNSIDWQLLVFLLLFLNVKLAVKAAALLLVFILQPDFRFGFKLHKSRLPLFYLFVIIIAAFNFILYSGYQQPHYLEAFVTGIFFWTCCILAIHQLKLFVDKNDAQVINNTLLIFFILNSIASLGNLVNIMLETGALNPYRYQGIHQKYFINTGDYIKGITFDTSVTNAAINAFGIIYFLYKKNSIMTLLCMFTLLLTGSNLVNLLVVGTLSYLFVFNTSRDQKSLIIICLMLLAIFMGKISPQNNVYLAESFERILHKKFTSPPQQLKQQTPLTAIDDALRSAEEKKQKMAMLFLDSVSTSFTRLQKPETTLVQQASLRAGLLSGARPELPKANIHSEPYQNRFDSASIQSSVISFIHKRKEHLPLTDNSGKAFSYPGKVIAFSQSLLWLHRFPQSIVTGVGMGNFSPKLAFKTTALNIAGGYPSRFSYIHPAFLSNHLDLYLYYASKEAKMNSILNHPDSVYGQLLTEYGVAGFIAFIFFYVAFFLKHVTSLTYSIPILLLLAALFFIGYWFEQLSIVSFFELIIFLNIKESHVRKRNGER